MSLAEDLKSKPSIRSCRTGEILGELSKDDREAVEAVLKTGSWSAKRLADKLTEYGHPVSFGQIKYHRTGYCKCFDKEPK